MLSGIAQTLIVLALGAERGAIPFFCCEEDGCVDYNFLSIYRFSKTLVDYANLTLSTNWA